MDLERLQNWLKDITYEKNSREGQSFRIEISNDRYVVTENSLEVLENKGEQSIESFEVSGLFERIKEFGKSLDSIIISKNMDEAIVKVPTELPRILLLVWKIFWGLSQNVYEAVPVRPFKTTGKSCSC